MNYMRQKVNGLWTIGEIMTDVDNWIIQELFGSDASELTIVGPGKKRNLFYQMDGMFDIEMVDYDTKWKDDNDIINKDIVFDEHEPRELIVNYAAEKMWPLGRMFKGREFILVGDSGHHNGDCNPITSCAQLIKQNELIEVYAEAVLPRWKGEYFMVHGCT